MAKSPSRNKTITFPKQSHLSKENEMSDCQRAQTPEMQFQIASESQTGHLAPFFFPRTVTAFIRF